MEDDAEEAVLLKTEGLLMRARERVVPAWSMDAHGQGKVKLVAAYTMWTVILKTVMGYESVTPHLWAAYISAAESVSFWHRGRLKAKGQ